MNVIKKVWNFMDKHIRAIYMILIVMIMYSHVSAAFKATGNFPISLLLDLIILVTAGFVIGQETGKFKSKTVKIDVTVEDTDKSQV